MFEKGAALGMAGCVPFPQVEHRTEKIARARGWIRSGVSHTEHFWRVTMRMAQNLLFARLLMQLLFDCSQSMSMSVR